MIRVGKRVRLGQFKLGQQLARFLDSQPLADLFFEWVRFLKPTPMSGQLTWPILARMVYVYEDARKFPPKCVVIARSPMGEKEQCEAFS